MNKCPVFNVTSILGKKWTVALIQEIALNGDKGFNFLFYRMRKISPKILSRRLEELEKLRIIEREVIFHSKPLRTKYVLTEKGEELQRIIADIKSLNTKYSDIKLECSNKECVKCGLY